MQGLWNDRNIDPAIGHHRFTIQMHYPRILPDNCNLLGFQCLNLTISIDLFRKS